MAPFLALRRGRIRGRAVCDRSIRPAVRLPALRLWPSCRARTCAAPPFAFRRSRLCPGCHPERSEGSRLGVWHGQASCPWPCAERERHPGCRTRRCCPLACAPLPFGRGGSGEALLRPMEHALRAPGRFACSRHRLRSPLPMRLSPLGVVAPAKLCFAPWSKRFARALVRGGTPLAHQPHAHLVTLTPLSAVPCLRLWAWWMWMVSGARWPRRSIASLMARLQQAAPAKARLVVRGGNPFAHAHASPPTSPAGPLPPLGELYSSRTPHSCRRPSRCPWGGKRNDGPRRS